MSKFEELLEQAIQECPVDGLVEHLKIVLASYRRLMPDTQQEA